MESAKANCRTKALMTNIVRSVLSVYAFKFKVMNQDDADPTKIMMIQRKNSTGMTNSREMGTKMNRE